MTTTDWILPITLLPAVGLFIMSTTALSSALSSELNLLIFAHHCSQPKIIKRKIVQLKLLSLALFGLYISASFFAVSGLLGGLFEQGHLRLMKTVNILLFIGVFFVVVALALLVIYAINAVKIKQQQFMDSLSEDQKKEMNLS